MGNGSTGPHGYIFRTANARQVVETADARTGWLRRCSSLTPSDGWAVVESPADCAGRCLWALVNTHDAGNSWSLQLNGGACWQIQSMDFITNQEGWVIESNSPCPRGNQKIKSRMMETMNGGRSWEKSFQPRPAAHQRSLRSSTGRVGTADGLTGGDSADCRTTVYNKNDMGQTWGRSWW